MTETVWRVNLTLASCWMHARRPFFKARAQNDDALGALDLIAKLADPSYWQYNQSP